MAYNFPQVIPGTVAYISVGGDTSCGLLLGESGFVWQCWGQNQSGQLGVGTSLSSPIPVSVLNQTAIDRYLLVATSGNTTCGTKANTTNPSGGTDLYCWGLDYSSNLNYSPTLIHSFVGDEADGITQLSVGENHSCAVGFAGSLRCWGDNTYGQLGAVTTSQQDPLDPMSGGLVKIDSSPSTPVIIDDSNSNQFGQSIGPKYAQVSVGLNHTCGITESGVLKCWGDNTYGQLGTGDTTSYPSPQQIDSSTVYSQVSAGDNFTCGITYVGNLDLAGSQPVLTPGIPAPLGAPFGVLKCWGMINASRKNLAEPTIMDLIPGDNNGSVEYLQISAGPNHACGITAMGELRCFGENSSGQLGDKTIISSTSPSSVSVLDETWTNNTDGSTFEGSLFKASTIDSTLLPRLVKYQKVSAGRGHTCGITADIEGSKIKCWGNNDYGQLGIGGLLNALKPTITGFTY